MRIRGRVAFLSTLVAFAIFTNCADAQSKEYFYVNMSYRADIFMQAKVMSVWLTDIGLQKVVWRSGTMVVGEQFVTTFGA